MGRMAGTTSNSITVTPFLFVILTLNVVKGKDLFALRIGMTGDTQAMLRHKQETDPSLRSG